MPVPVMATIAMSYQPNSVTKKIDYQVNIEIYMQVVGNIAIQCRLTNS
jgi:hypothetical protein